MVHYFPFYPPPSDQPPFPAPPHYPVQSPPPSHSFPPPPPSSRPHQPPPPPSHFVPPSPSHPHFPPPPYPLPHHPPPPPHVLPPPPPGHHSTVIIVIVISLGSLFFLAFLAAALFCYLKKRRVSSLKTEITMFDEHVKVQQVIVPGPHGEPTRVVMLEEDIHLEGDILKTEKLSRAHRVNSEPNHHLIEHNA
ncbi:hypothetical protein EUTSA_v10012251mg [Eutrema salsugineum]|uniref:Uncharacterized protein n=1 Tax=Eutrema salsugineum TaxID=72664 RepID=V4JWK6_EUTSA|nr:proline-rich receptor-like protein kinase PERK10 [Eutrema salsugineum]ESQ29835.1 hypothetical protein EUTSA_v10012251mg [Eutrema salsugineum]